MFLPACLSRSRYHRPAWPRGPWPDDSQLLLLQACLLPDREAARAAWTAWRGRLRLDEIDGGSTRLLPLLHARLSEWGIHGEDRIKGVARYFWVRTQQQMHCLRGVLTALAGTEIETLLLKGAALNLAVYPVATRPMVDLDIVVPRRKAKRAMQLLRETGWKSTSADPERLIGAIHGCQFEAPGERFIDLHWDFFHARVLSPEQQEPLWTASERIDAFGIVSRVLAPAHQLLHTCVHGARCSAAPPVRWLADACWIVRRQGDRMDWDVLVDLAREHELSLPVWKTLAFLAEQLAVSIPAHTLRALRRAPVSTSAALEHFLASREATWLHPFWNSLPFHLVGYWRHRRRQKQFRLGEYLRLQHHFDRPVSRYLPHLGLVLVADAVRAVWNWGLNIFGRAYRLDFGSPDHWRFQGFSKVERWRGRLYRWSSAEARVVLADLPGADCRVEITLAGLRDWHADLAKHLSISFNGHPIPPDQIVFRHRRASFRIPSAQFVPADRQQLAFRCEPLRTRPGDPRRAGCPHLFHSDHSGADETGARSRMKVSCLIVTQESRWEHFRRACRCFLRQTWPDKELVVAAFGTRDYLDRLGRFCRELPAATATAFTDSFVSLGELRNLSVQAATGEIVCQWDDDDQYHPRRVEIQSHALIDESADLCLLSDYWHYFADTGELYWVDCRYNEAGERWTKPHLQALPGSLTARRAAMLAYTADTRGEDGLFLLYATIRRRKFTLIHGAGWCYLYVYHGGNTWQHTHHERYVRQRGRIVTPLTIADLTGKQKSTFDPTFSLPQVLSRYEFDAKLTVVFDRAA